MRVPPELQQPVGVNPLMGPPDPFSDASIMGPNQRLRPDLLGGPDTIT
jgi:hypothetical protein